MINSLKDLAEFMELDFYNIEYPCPGIGYGGNVAEIYHTYSWDAVLASAEQMSEMRLKEVLLYSNPISFHNNSHSGHASVGASWTIRHFLGRQGGMELQDKVKKLMP